MAYTPFKLNVLADASSVTPDSNADMNAQTNTQGAGSLTVNAPTGNGKRFIFRIKSTNAQTYAFNAVYRGGTTALPTASTAGKTDYLVFIKHEVDSKWDLIGSETNH